jgi:hypothetical protein
VAGARPVIDAGPMTTAPAASAASELSTIRSENEVVLRTVTLPRMLRTLPSPTVTTSAEPLVFSVSGSPARVASTSTGLTPEPVMSVTPPRNGAPTSCTSRQPSSVVMVPPSTV